MITTGSRLGGGRGGDRGSAREGRLLSLLSSVAVLFPLFPSVLAPPTVDRRTLQTMQPTCLLFLPPASPEVGQSKKENEAGRRDNSLFFHLFQPP